jgi:serine/threonine protein kinase
VQFQIVGTLGGGGRGEVFLGQIIPTREAVVVKYPRNPEHPSVRRRFAREVRILARQFSGFVSLLAFDVDGPRPYYVMRFLRNGSIAKHRGRLSEAQLFAVASELSSTLTELHAAGIAHGDVKPDNVLISDERRVVLADPLGNGWGCTMMFSNDCGGTPGYWAPEIQAGQPISAAGDMYSFGVSLHELATGQCPVDGLSPNMALTAKFDPRLRDIIGACCSANSGERPLAKDIATLLSGHAWQDVKKARRQGQVGLFVVGLLTVCALTLEAG